MCTVICIDNDSVFRLQTPKYVQCVLGDIGYVGTSKLTLIVKRLPKTHDVEVWLSLGHSLPDFP